MGAKYITDPQEVYKLELKKLQFCFAELQKIGEEASELSRVGWRQVQFLQQVNFILQEATQTGEQMLKLPLT